MVWEQKKWSKEILLSTELNLAGGGGQRVGQWLGGSLENLCREGCSLVMGTVLEWCMHKKSNLQSYKSWYFNKKGSSKDISTPKKTTKVAYELFWISVARETTNARMTMILSDSLKAGHISPMWNLAPLTHIHTQYQDIPSEADKAKMFRGYK